MFRSSCCCLPRRLDPDHKLKVKEVTLLRYTAAFKSFVDHLVKHNHIIWDFAQVDGFAVDFKNHNNLSKSQLDYLLAALEYFYPALKGQLPWTKAVAAGKAAAHQTKHTVPLTSAPAKLRRRALGPQNCYT